MGPGRGEGGDSSVALRTVPGWGRCSHATGSPAGRRGQFFRDRPWGTVFTRQLGAVSRESSPRSRPHFGLRQRRRGLLTGKQRRVRSKDGTDDLVQLAKARKVGRDGRRFPQPLAVVQIQTQQLAQQHGPRWAAQTLQVRLDAGEMAALPLRLEVGANAVQIVTDRQRQAVEVGQVVEIHDPRSCSSQLWCRAPATYLL